MKMKTPANRRSGSRVLFSASIVLLAGLLFVQTVAAGTTYMSAEPIPSKDVVGDDKLAKILDIGYSNLELWSKRLLNQCHIVDSVINALSSNGAISTVRAGNTRFEVAAGGFESVTDPTFVFTLRDTTP